jgi:hypothetical protein
MTAAASPQNGWHVRIPRSLLTYPPVLLVAIALGGCATPVAVDDTVLPSGIYTSVVLTFTAVTHAVTPTAAFPSTPISYPASAVIWSVTSTPTAGAYWLHTSCASGCDNAAYVSDVTISDGTELAPGQAFTKAWEFANTGSRTWSKAYSITFVSGNDMNGSDTEINQSVASGAYADISVSLTAPDEEGTYIGYWRLADKRGTVFGEQVYVQIVVSEAAATGTASATTAAPTSTPSPTSISPGATPTSTGTSTRSTATPTPTSIFIRDAPTSTPVPLLSTGTPAAMPTSSPQVLPMKTPND